MSTSIIKPIVKFGIKAAAKATGKKVSRELDENIDEFFRSSSFNPLECPEANKGEPELLKKLHEESLSETEREKLREKEKHEEEMRKLIKSGRGASLYPKLDDKDVKNLMVGTKHYNRDKQMQDFAYGYFNYKYS